MWSALEVGSTRCNFPSSKQLLIFKFAAVPYVQCCWMRYTQQPLFLFYFFLPFYGSVCSFWKVRPVQVCFEEPVCSHHQLTSCFVYLRAAYLTPVTPIYISYIIIMYECIMQSPLPLDIFFFFYNRAHLFIRTDRCRHVAIDAHAHRHADTYTHAQRVTWCFPQGLSIPMCSNHRFQAAIKIQTRSVSN